MISIQKWDIYASNYKSKGLRRPKAPLIFIEFLLKNSLHRPSKALFSAILKNQGTTHNWVRWFKFGFFQDLNEVNVNMVNTKNYQILTGNCPPRPSNTSFAAYVKTLKGHNSAHNRGMWVMFDPVRGSIGMTYPAIKFGQNMTVNSLTTVLQTFPPFFKNQRAIT